MLVLPSLPFSLTQLFAHTNVTFTFPSSRVLLLDPPRLLVHPSTHPFLLDTQTRPASAFPPLGSLRNHPRPNASRLIPVSLTSWTIILHRLPTFGFALRLSGGYPSCHSFRPFGTLTT